MYKRNLTSSLSTDEKERGEDEADVVTRATLKHRSQLIIDAKTKRRTRVKKSKEKIWSVPDTLAESFIP